MYEDYQLNEIAEIIVMKQWRIERENIYNVILKNNQMAEKCGGKKLEFILPVFFQNLHRTYNK